MLGVLNKVLVNFAHGGGRFNCHISNHRLINKLAFISFPCLIALSVALLNPPALTNLLDQHQSASATTGTAVAATPNLTLTNANTSASIDIAALDPIGSFATSSNNDSATFTLTTNNTTGYTLSIAADDDNGSLLRPVDNPGDTPDSLESISSITTTSDFSARTQEAATSYNGKWGIRPSKYVDTNTTTPVDNTGDNPVYLPSPTASNPTILDKTTTANTNNTENSYTIALGVRADHTIHAGTYSRTFKLLAVANPVSYSIAFNQNTNDTVTNMPSTQSSDAITSTTVTLPSTVPARAHYSFLGWCNLQPTTTNGIDSCTGTNPTTGAAATVYNPNGNGTNLTYGIDHTTTNNATLYAMWKIDTFTQTTEVRYENADGTWGSYNTVDTQTLNYGSSYSWSTAQITNFDSAAYQAASVSSYTVTEAHTNQVSIYRNTFTCTKQYRLEAGNGDWGNYDPDGTIENVRYGSTCSYTKSVDYYTSQTASVDNVTSNQTLSVSLPRTTYSLTVSAGSNTSNPSGSGTYRWGQAVSVGVTRNTDTTCTSYDTPTWTQSGTAGTFSSTSGTSTTFTMGKGNATVTATSAAQSKGIYVALSRGSGVNGIIINGTEYTGTAAYLTCGTYNISGSYASGYEFDSWSTGGVVGAVVVANPASATTTVTISGGMGSSLALAGKQSCVAISGYLQNFTGTANYCSTTGTLTDSRDGTSYTVGKLADGKWWLLDNLALDLTNSTVLASLSTSNTNVTSDATLTSLRYGNRDAGDQYANGPLVNLTDENSFNVSVARVNADYKDQTKPLAMYQSGTGKIGVYYNFCAASAGSYCYGYDANVGKPSGNATEDICPKGWRMPTREEYGVLYAAHSDHKAEAFVYALRTPLSGYFVSGSAGNQGSYGYFWSSTRYSNGSMYYLRVGTSDVRFSDNARRHYGYSIRCILGS